MKKIVAVLLVILALSSVCVFAETNQFVSFYNSGMFSYVFPDDELLSYSSLGFAAVTGWENDDFCFSIDASMDSEGYSGALSYSRFFGNGLFLAAEVGVGTSTADKSLLIGAMGIVGIRLDGIGKSWIELGLAPNFTYQRSSDLSVTDLSLCLIIDDYCPISDSMTMMFGATVAGITIFTQEKDLKTGETESLSINSFGIMLRAGLKYSFPATPIAPKLKTK